MKKYQTFLSENVQFLEVKFSIYLNRHVFVMDEKLLMKTTKSLIILRRCAGWFESSMGAHIRR